MVGRPYEDSKNVTVTIPSYLVKEIHDFDLSPSGLLRDAAVTEIRKLKGEEAKKIAKETKKTRRKLRIKNLDKMWDDLKFLDRDLANAVWFSCLNTRGFRKKDYLVQLNDAIKLFKEAGKNTAIKQNLLSSFRDYLRKRKEQQPPEKKNVNIKLPSELEETYLEDKENEKESTK